MDAIVHKTRCIRKNCLTCRARSIYLLQQARDILYSKAQNDEMVDQYYTEYGKRMNQLANDIDAFLNYTVTDFDEISYYK